MNGSVSSPSGEPFRSGTSGLQTAAEEDYPFFGLHGEPRNNGAGLARLVSTPRYQFILLAVLTIFLCSIKLDNGGLMKYDECYYAQKAKEMVQSGDWLTPRFAGRATHDNPPGHMWIIAASYKIFGINEWGARFPTVIETVLIVMMTYLLARWLFRSSWVAFLSGSGLLLCDYFYKYSRKAHMDHLMTLLFLIALVSFIAGRRKHQAWFILTGATAGYAVLTKSVLGLFSIISIFVYIIITREWRLLKRPLLWVGLVVSALIVFVWYYQEYRIFGARFLDIHVRWLLYSRSIMGSTEAADRTVPNYLLKMANNLYLFFRDAHVWLILGIAGIVSFFKRKREAPACSDVHRREAVLLAAGGIAPLLIMSLAGEFKSWYLMPVFVPFVIFSAVFLSRILKTERRTAIAGYVFLSLLTIHLSILIVAPIFTLDMKHDIRNPGIRKLATKIRMLDPENGTQTVLFPATDEIAKDCGMRGSPFSYQGIASPWNFYSDHPLRPRSDPATLAETRVYMDEEEGICLTTAEGFDVISDSGRLPYKVIGRVVQGNEEYVTCCSADYYMKRRRDIERDFSRPPLYSLRRH
ncbi:MAG: glycosyltransferase family 39 protein [bacterium]|nr:MAG: glycosyltransferase family 39 protein [bacterium]